MIDPEVEAGLRDRREAKLYAPVYNGLAAGLAFGGSLFLSFWSAADRPGSLRQLGAGDEQRAGSHALVEK